MSVDLGDGTFRELRTATATIQGPTLDKIEERAREEFAKLFEGAKFRIVSVHATPFIYGADETIATWSADVNVEEVLR